MTSRDLDRLCASILADLRATRSAFADATPAERAAIARVRVLVGNLAWTARGLKPKK